MSRAFDLLGLPVGAQPTDIQARWFELVKIHDPMYGGNPRTFKELRQAYREAMAMASAPMACPKCAGAGSTVTIFGRSTIRKTCAECKGAGSKQGGKRDA